MGKSKQVKAERIVVPAGRQVEIQIKAPGCSPNLIVHGPAVIILCRN
jgi:hypothetical protein